MCHCPSAMGAGIAWRKCSCRVAQSGQRSCTSRVAQSWELRNLSEAVAQLELRNPTSCASRAAQSWKLRKRGCTILGVAQAKFRNASYSTASPKRTLAALWQQHLAAAPCSGTSSQAPKHKQHAAPCSGTLQRQPATKLQSANSTLTAAPCSGTLLLGPQPSSKTQARNPTKELRNLSCAIRRSCAIGLYSNPTGQVSDPSLVAVQSWTLHRQKVADDHPPGPLSSPATRESNSPPPMPLAVLWGWADGSTNQPVTWPTCNTNRCVCVCVCPRLGNISTKIDSACWHNLENNGFGEGLPFPETIHWIRCVTRTTPSFSYPPERLHRWPPHRTVGSWDPRPRCAASHGEAQQLQCRWRRPPATSDEGRWNESAKQSPSKKTKQLKPPEVVKKIRHFMASHILSYLSYY